MEAGNRIWVSLLFRAIFFSLSAMVLTTLLMQVRHVAKMIPDDLIIVEIVGRHISNIRDFCRYENCFFLAV
jgi:hypothetical protein